MSIKISIKEATDRYGVTQRTIFRWIEKYEIHQFDDGTLNRDQLDALNEGYSGTDYLDVDWSRANCKELPTDFFYKIEDRGVSKLIDVDVFRQVCAPCPIWQQCLRYASTNEDYGVWGGMTSEERKAMKDFHKSALKDKVFADFKRHGISKEMILQTIGRV